MNECERAILRVDVPVLVPAAIQDLHANHSNNNVMPKALYEPLVIDGSLSRREHDTNMANVRLTFK